MAHPFLVIEHINPRAGENRYSLLRDGFAFWALLFPLPWLFVQRLWLEAGLLLGAYFALGALAASGSLVWIAALYVFNTVAALWVALDGRHWMIEKQLARGGRLATIVEADNREEAELRFALTPRATAPAQTVAKLQSMSVRQPKSHDMLFATPWGNS